MAYTNPVKFTKTGQYGCGPDDEDDVYTIEEFKQLCGSTMFVDSDGCGHPVKDNLADMQVWVWPSQLDKIPADATHIVWFNR